MYSKAHISGSWQLAVGSWQKPNRVITDCNFLSSANCQLKSANYLLAANFLQS
jgi:hypothetical protein